MVSVIAASSGVGAGNPWGSSRGSLRGGGRENISCYHGPCASAVVAYCRQPSRVDARRGWTCCFARSAGREFSGARECVLPFSSSRVPSGARAWRSGRSPGRGTPRPSCSDRVRDGVRVSAAFSCLAQDYWVGNCTTHSDHHL